MANAPDLSIELHPVGGKARPLSQFLTTFPLAAVVLDPYTHESSWLLDTAHRILTIFREADVRVAFLVTGTGVDGASQFLGPLTDQILTLADPDRSLVRSLGLETLPAFVAIRHLGADFSAGPLSLGRLLVGALCIVGAWYYTGGSRPYGYAGLGEVAVFVFFGPVAVLGTMLTQAGRVDAAAVQRAVQTWLPQQARAVVTGVPGKPKVDDPKKAAVRVRAWAETRTSSPFSAL